MPKPRNTLKNETTILWISFVAGLGCAVVELLGAIYTHSESVLMDAAYDASELIIIILTLFLTPLFHKPISEKHPYGFLQVESIFIIIKSFMLLSVTVGLSVSSIQTALSGGNHVNGGQISLFQLCLGLFCLAIYLLMRHLNRSLSSPTVHAELLGWKLDISYSLGLSIAFFLSQFLSITPLAFLAPYFDQIVAVAVVLFMLPENLSMLWQAIQDVFLFAPGDDITDQVKEICEPILAQYQFEPLFYDITRTGRRLWISVYFQIAQDALSIQALQNASTQVRSALSEQFDSCTSELIVTTDHAVDPAYARCMSVSIPSNEPEAL